MTGFGNVYYLSLLFGALWGAVWTILVTVLALFVTGEAMLRQPVLSGRSFSH